MLKTVVLHNIFVETVKDFVFQDLFETEIVCDIINVLSVTFGQFNASFMNKSINFFLTQNIWQHDYFKHW